MSKDIQKYSDMGWGTTPYTGKDPSQLQYQKDRANAAQMSGMSKSYVWLVRGKEIMVTDPDKLDRLYSILNVPQDHHGPIAKGVVDISNRWTASFLIQESSIDLDTLYRLFQKWAKNPTFFENGEHSVMPTHLYVAVVKDANGFPLPVGNMSKTAADPGHGDLNKTPWKNRDREDIRTDIQIWDPDQGKLPGQDVSEAYEGDMTKMYECSECHEEFDSYIEYELHCSHDHVNTDGQTGHEEEIRDNDETFYPDNEYSRMVFFEARVASPEDSDAPEGPIPFSFDVEKDRLYVGNPGEEGVKLDQDNPFGRAEGYYTPDGDLLITSQANIPYTVKHLMNLWSDFYPEYEIKHVYLIERKDDLNIREKVANA